MFNILNGYENIDSNIFFEIKESKIARGQNFTFLISFQKLLKSLQLNLEASRSALRVSAFFPQSLFLRLNSARLVFIISNKGPCRGLPADRQNEEGLSSGLMGLTNQIIPTKDKVLRRRVMSLSGYCACGIPK